MRLIIIVSVAMLLAASLTEAADEPGFPETGIKSSSKKSGSKQKAKASGHKADYGKPKGDDILLHWEETVDAKTAKKIRNLMNKEKGRATSGKANGMQTVKIIIEAKVNKSKAEDWLDDLIIKEPSTSDAQSSTSDSKASSGTTQEGQSSNDDDKSESEGKDSDDDKEAKSNVQ